MARWVEVPAEVAAEHPLHGMRGWLRFFSLWIALAAIGGAVLGWQDVRALMEGRDVAEAAVNLATSVVQLVVAALWFATWRHFRVAFLGVTVVATLVAVGFNLWEWQASGGRISDALAEQMASDIAGTAALGVLLAYMQRSRRFRVTFEGRVRREEAGESPGGQGDQPPP